MSNVVDLEQYRHEHESKDSGTDRTERKLNSNLLTIEEIDGSRKIKFLNERLYDVRFLSEQDKLNLSREILQPNKECEENLLATYGPNRSEEEIEELSERCKQAMNDNQIKIRGFKILFNFLNNILGSYQIAGERSGERGRLFVMENNQAQDIVREFPVVGKNNELNPPLDQKPDTGIHHYFVVSKEDGAALAAQMLQAGKDPKTIIEHDWGLLLDMNGVHMAFLYPDPKKKEYNEAGKKEIRKAA